MTDRGSRQVGRVGQVGLHWSQAYLPDQPYLPESGIRQLKFAASSVLPVPL